LKYLLIVESPAKSSTIEKYLGKDYKVLASIGHIRDLPSKDGSVDVDNDFEMKYQTSKDKEKQIKTIVAAAKKADTIYLATDLDREGEAISWHVLEELKERIKDFSMDKVKRIVFNEITKKAVQDAVDNPRELDMDLVNAQQARRALDYLVGFNLSPVLWRKVKGGLSAGRVQSVALRLVCEREDDIDAFKPQEYWSIEGTFHTPENKALTAKLSHLNGKKLDKFDIGNEGLATEAVDKLTGQDYSITEIQKKQTRRSASAPFITSTLQMEASRKLGFGAKRTMMTAQRLYEAGFITYMRTDSVSLSPEALAATRQAIENMYGSTYVPKSPNVYKTKSQNAQEAHEAIRPTSLGKTPSATGLTDADQLKLYKLIWQRTVASQMEKAILDQTALVISTGSGDAFRATGSIVAFDGFMKAYQEGSDDEKAVDDSKDKLLPAVNEHDAMDLVEMKPNQHFTEPPARYSEATLVKTLEEKGVGRPSTFASIISTIQDRGYVRQDKKRFHPEDVGRIVSKFLVQHFSRYVDINFTAGMEEKLDEVSRGENDWKPMLRDFWSPFKETIDDKMESVKKSDVTTEKTGEKCPSCDKGELLIRLGRYGRFKGCDQYPECKHIENLEGNTSESRGEQEPPKDTGVQCPKCKENQIVEKKSRRGKIFYGCGGYPKCQYAVWDKTIPETKCPSCDWPFIMEKETKRQGLIKKCPDCEWQDPPKPEPKTKPKRTAVDDANGAISDAASGVKTKKKTTTKKKASTAKKKATTAKKKSATTKKKAATTKKRAVTKKADTSTEAPSAEDINAAIMDAMG